ncbi:UDP-glucuronosyltransferase 2A2-like [Hypanus sabinus]|uniref:UDP-glucuronosyltransferase 2A2-like n=1 Tax=Hypanus sabinus TaxID=79690 RepID=UPI0028C4A3E6|nr:UDP-glucuronosyltransferase 2A2-like [Hypanus sabinus]XP_059808850.1 UDP-glucuronosyltransferase 2A2-like [Hypanus sabinus]
MEGFGWESRALVPFLFGIIISLLCTITQSANVLVVPVDGSHWINMRILLEELKPRGHNFTVIYIEESWYINERPNLYQSIVIPLKNIEVKDIVEIYLHKTLQLGQDGWSFSDNIEFQSVILQLVQRCQKIFHLTTSEIFQNKTLLSQLEKANFDLVLSDPFFVTGSMLAYYLKLPLVYNVRWLESGEAHFLFVPSPLSYVPILGSNLTDKMSFLQRTQNFIQHLIFQSIVELTIYPKYNELCHRYLGPDTDIKTILLRADVWLMRVDFVLEFPRPTMPNIVYIGGFQCKPAQPLAAEFEEFVQSSGKHGLIVMSLGSFIHSLPKQITMEIAEAFAQVPQKVIWRYDGEIPPNVGNNTLLRKWIPQNDLLGHPNTRVFISHGGTNGIYEAIYHGVPVIGMPLIFDQFDNLLRLESRGAAKVLNVATMHSTNLLQALHEVINGTFYWDNMKKLSALHRDQPVSPMERAVFWIEYVARHKGAGHLRSESYRLPWYAYYCVDVMVLLLSMLLMAIVLVVVALKRLCHIAWKKKQKNE